MKYLASWLVVWLLVTTSSSIYATEIGSYAELIAVSNVPSDTEIAARLNAITAAITGSEQVDITVNAGVINLHGEVATIQLSREIEKIASRLQGVVYVQNNLQEQLAVSSRLAPAAEKFHEILNKLIKMLPLLLLALVIIVGFALLGATLSKRSVWLRRFGLSELASNLGMRFIRLIITIIGVLIALELLDATALVSAALGIAVLLVSH